MRTSVSVPLTFLVGLVVGCGPAEHLRISVDDQAVTIDVLPILVPAGVEVQKCLYMKVPTHVDLDIGEVTMQFSQGTHHAHVYTSDVPHDDGIEDCFQAVDFDRWHLFVATQNEHLDWALPDGVGMRLLANQQVLVQVHYVNAGLLTTTGNVGAGTIRLGRMSSDQVQQHMGAAFGQQRMIDLPPMAHSSIEGMCRLPRAVNIAAFAGHYHFRGQSFTGFQSDKTGTQMTQFYQTTDFAEPTFEIFGADAPLRFTEDQRIVWRCDYQNDTNSEIGFGPRETDQEHCNMFAFYYPALSAQEFTPCVSFGRCEAPCAAGERCASSGDCVAE